MPTRFDKPVRRQQDRDRRAPGRNPDEPRHVDAASHDSATEHGQGGYAGFDDQLNPIDDEDINTHGSER